MTAKILVVDDSITIQKIVAMAFENEDAIVEGIGNGSEALERLKTFKPNVVLADIDMPGLTGFELSREIKTSPELDSIYVLLLASDFEEFDENLFQASLADNHITKPFKSEDLVRKVMGLLGRGSQVAVDEEQIDDDTEEVILLTATDRVDQDIVLDLSTNQQMDSPEAILDEEEAELILPPSQEWESLIQEEDSKPDEFKIGIQLENVGSDQPLEEEPPVEVAASVNDPAEIETTGQEEDLDELLLKVEELSRQSNEISGNGHQQELSPMEAIDEMLKEVHALKEETFGVSAKEENNFKETTESPFPTEATNGEAVLAEVDTVNEENAEALASAFDEITNGSDYPFPSAEIEPLELPESFLQDDAVEAASENPSEEFLAPSISTSPENSLPDLEEPIPLFSNGKPSASLEKTQATGEPDENIENSDASPLTDEGSLNQLMEEEVRKILQQSLTPLIEKEISGLSEKILRAVEENVRKITPGIAKTIIENEIDKIKTMEDG